MCHSQSDPEKGSEDGNSWSAKDGAPEAIKEQQIVPVNREAC